MPIPKKAPSQNHLAPLKQKGWSLRTAAARLAVTHSHLHRVLTGERQSRALMARVRSLPTLPPRKK
jgi:lambda repressor-like predicted transcriptional regulator